MGPLLAEEATFAFPELVVPSLVAAVAGTVLWLVLLLAAAFATRPRDVDPAPATMELGEESPAVVDLLTNDWRVTPDAVPATLLDLAARGFVDLDQHGKGGRCAACAAPPGAGSRRTSGWSWTTSPGWRWTGWCRPRRSPPVPRMPRPSGGGRSRTRWSTTPVLAA